MADFLELYQFTDGHRDHEHRFTKDFIVKMWEELYGWDSARAEGAFRQAVADGGIGKASLKDIAAGVKP